jgi:hypothetical protein
VLRQVAEKSPVADARTEILTTIGIGSDANRRARLAAAKGSKHPSTWVCVSPRSGADGPFASDPCRCQLAHILPPRAPPPRRPETPGRPRRRIRRVPARPTRARRWRDARARRLPPVGLSKGRMLLLIHWSAVRIRPGDPVNSITSDTYLMLQIRLCSGVTRRRSPSPILRQDRGDVIERLLCAMLIISVALSMRLSSTCCSSTGFPLISALAESRFIVRFT